PQIQIRELNRLAVRDAKPPVHACRLREFSGLPAFATCSRIHWFIICIVWSARRLRQILARAKTRIKKATLTKPSPSLQIVHPALTLRVWTIRPARIGALAPANSQPAQILHLGASKFRPRALGVQVLISQNQSSLMLDRPSRC